MNKGLLAIVLMIPGLLITADAIAALTSARATPPQTQITADTDKVVAITWRVSTTSDHIDGVTSPLALLVDPATGNVLQTVNTSYDIAGAGPFTIRETLPLDALTVSDWVNRGIERVVYTRDFLDASGNPVTASIVLRISGSRLQATREAAPAELEIASLQLEFPSGNNAALANVDDSLRATLTVVYSGTGVLRGRWLISEPESPGATPLYRTLGLVSKNLATSQRSTMLSPAVPTARSGNYVLRFCVVDDSRSSTGLDSLCPDAGLVAVASYQVQGTDNGGMEQISDLSPDRQPVNAKTVFSFGSVAGAHIYQLQIFELAPSDADLPGSRNESGSVEPRFVTGILLDDTTTETALSELVRSKLETGRRYLWRVTAHDATGRMVGRSQEASFVFAAGE